MYYRKYDGTFKQFSQFVLVVLNNAPFKRKLLRKKLAGGRGFTKEISVYFSVLPDKTALAQNLNRE